MPQAIRRLHSKDVAAWDRLFRAYIDFYGASVSDSTIALTFRRLIEGDDLVGLVAASVTDDVIGFSHVVFHRSTWSPTCYGYLEDLFVDPANRAGGIGRALIEASAREAEHRGATRLYWVTQDSNVAARRLYDKVATLAPFVQYRR